MLELDDDPETLRVALAFLDGEDVSISAPALDVSDSPSSSTDGPGESEQPPTKKRVMSSLTRQRMNILALREEIQRLEGELRAEKRKSKKRASVYRERDELWKAIALRQRRAHERAEADCVSLRTRIEARLCVEGKIAAALLAGMQSQNAIPRSLRHRWSIDETFARLETMYKRTDSAFSPKCYASGSKKLSDMQITSDGGHGMTIESRNSWATPFPVNAVEESVWKYMANMHISVPDLDYHADNQASDDSIVTKYVFPPQENESEYQAEEVTKKFGRLGQPTVVVTTYLGELTDSTDEELLVHELWWVRVQAIHTSAEERLTQVQSCSRTHIRSRNPETLACWVEQVVQDLKDESEHCQATIETSLLCYQGPRMR